MQRNRKWLYTNPCYYTAKIWLHSFTKKLDDLRETGKTYHVFGLDTGLKAYDGAELAQNKWTQPAQKPL